MEAATATRAPARAPRRAAAPAKRAPARKAPARRPQPARRPGGQLIPLAVGTATAVGRLPESGLIHHMTRGRVWIGVLGAMLAGIVALNVVTLSLGATAGRIDQQIQTLDRENSVLRSRDAQLSAAARVRREASALGLTAQAAEGIEHVRFEQGDAAAAAARLAAAG